MCLSVITKFKKLFWAIRKLKMLPSTIRILKVLSWGITRLKILTWTTTRLTLQAHTLIVKVTRFEYVPGLSIANSNSFEHPFL